MWKMGTTVVALIAAVPGALLAYVTVMGLLSHADQMPTMMKIVVGLSALMGVVLLATPVVAFVTVPRSPYKARPKPAKKKEAVVADEEEDLEDAAIMSADDIEVVDEEEDVEIASTSSGDIDEFDFDEEDNFGARSDDELKIADASADDDFDFDFEDEDETKA